MSKHNTDKYHGLNNTELQSAVYRLDTLNRELLAALKQLLAEVEEMTRRSGWAGNGGRAMASAAIDKAESQS